MRRELAPIVELIAEALLREITHENPQAGRPAAVPADSGPVTDQKEQRAEHR
jgi:hypothetical protein